MSYPTDTTLQTRTITDGLRFQVYGLPQPGGSKRAFVVGKRAMIVDANPKAKDWKTTVAQTVAEQYDGPLLTGALELNVTFIMPRPKGHYGTGRNAGVLKTNAPKFHIVRPDSTKLLRPTEDALTGIIWRDDAQLAIRAMKLYGERPGAFIEVRRMEDGVL